MSTQITTAEAARMTGHKSRETFRKWAKRFYPELLRRLPHRRDLLVDEKRLQEYLRRLADSDGI